MTMTKAVANNNPSVLPGKINAERKRIPMSVPVQKLEVPDIPGYHLHWFRGDAARIQRALQAGYEFVDERETQVNSVGLGNNSTASGNTDMGSRVSVLSGDRLDSGGQPERLVLMKLKEELYEADLQITDERNEAVAASLRGGTVSPDRDMATRYLDKDRTATNLFTRKS